MGVRPVLLSLCVSLLLLAPAAQGQGLGPQESAPTTLYLHLLNAQNDVPMNTQEPDPGYTLAAHVAVMTHSLCLDEVSGLPPPVGQPVADKEWHTLFAYPSPSLVDYTFLEDGKPRIHPERGLALDVELDLSMEPVLHWYLATTPGATSGEADSAPMAIPNVVVRATMREGDAISVGNAAYREGNVILQGTSDPALLAGPATQGARHTELDGRHVYEISVPLAIEAPIVPRSTSFNLEVETFVENPYCSGEGDYVMPNAVDVFTADGFRPRLELGVRNPLQADYVHPHFVGGDLVVDAAVASPWGAYDIAWLNATILGSPFALVKQAVPQYHCHCYDDPPLPTTWVLENATKLLDGATTVLLEAETLQGHRWSATAEFQDGTAAQAMPGLPVPTLLAILAILGLLRRRRP